MQEQYQQAIAQYRQRIFSFAHYSLRAKEDAEDITQEVFIKLWQNWQKIDHSKLNAWLMRVAHNAVIDHVRKRKNHVENTDEYAEPDVQPAADEEVHDQLDNAAFKQQLMECIQELDDPFRSIIIMRDIQGQSYADIQHGLDMSESQVKVYLHRGRRKLRENSDLRRLFDLMAGQQSEGRGSRAVNIKVVKPARDKQG